MPELPEVEAVRRELAPAMLRSRIVRAAAATELTSAVSAASLRRDSKARRSIRSIGVAKLLVRVTSGETLLMHLGMSGSFRVDARSRRDRGPQLASRSSRPRRLRAVEWLDRDLQRSAAVRRDGSDRGRAGRRSRSLHALGLEPLDAALTRPRSRACAGRRVALKVALLDQRIVAGLGNIYASEALHRAGLSPLRRASTIATVSGRPRAHAVRLTSAIKIVLLEAIARSERPYRAGRFRVYEREGERCPKRGCGGTIRRIWQAGRSTFYCPRCQR